VTDAHRAWLGTSWKMNKTRADTAGYLAELIGWAQTSTTDASVTIFPPFTSLDTAGAILAAAAERRQLPDAATGRPTLRLGAQNMHWEARGAHTGEISADMLTDCGVQAVEIGHFERREHHGESDRTVGLKTTRATAAGLEAVVCVGESAADRHYGVAAETVARQVKIALHGLVGSAFASIVLAYEPGWAIGRDGDWATPAEVGAMREVMLAAVRAAHGPTAAGQVRVVYGGSVDPTNAPDYARAGVDGLFIGRAALSVAGFVSVIEQFSTASALLADDLVYAKGQAL
jgi:triosephosphate isomerase